ncbi:hypothetical protein J1N35_002518 [Gossypium stocksii]|uniref:RNase H type-1 domain-containing protein n=1 Tax=Gossypium stocksii TaxID=47602 RepID=A0A9D3WL62_9ROSI|nr:hypothetical protein J1N35_002518 [Gossypium stocksii]
MALEIVKASFNWAQQFDFSHRDIQHSSQTIVSRAHMANTWVNLFTNGVVASGDGSAFARGVLRDQHENWILGFSHFLGRCSFFGVEL